MSEFFDRLLGGATRREAPAPFETMPQEVEMPQVPKVRKPKSTIVDAHEKALSLVNAMKQKKTYWELEIANATEELRQVEAVLAGGLLLLERVALGLTKDNVAASETEMFGDDFEKAVEGDLTSNRD